MMGRPSLCGRVDTLREYGLKKSPERTSCGYNFCCHTAETLRGSALRELGRRVAPVLPNQLYGVMLCYGCVTSSDETAWVPIMSATSNNATRADGGSDMTLPMEMDFFIAVPAEMDGLKIGKSTEVLGFKVEVKNDSDSGDWTCYCTKVIIADYSTVVEIEQQLDAIAKNFGGYADGFGSYGNV